MTFFSLNCLSLEWWLSVISVPKNNLETLSEEFRVYISEILIQYVWDGPRNIHFKKTSVDCNAMVYMTHFEKYLPRDHGLCGPQALELCTTDKGPQYMFVCTLRQMLLVGKTPLVIPAQNIVLRGETEGLVDFVYGLIFFDRKKLHTEFSNWEQIVREILFYLENT